MNTTRTDTMLVGGVPVTLNVQQYPDGSTGEYVDVVISNIYFITILYEQREEFVSDLRDLVNKYRI